MATDGERRSAGMTCRITLVATEEGTLVRVAGRLDAESLRTLEKSCRGARLPLTLDLEGMRWIDDPATACLKQLIADGARVIHASPYVALRLHGQPQETFPR